MPRKLLVNLVLLAVVAGLGLVAWLQPGKTPEPAARLLTDRSPDSVRQLAIEQPDGRRLAFERDGGQWRMTEPYRMPGNSMRLDALARVVEVPEISGFPLPAEKKAEFGLDKPIRLRLDDQLFEFGGNDPINYHRYVLHQGRLSLIVDRFPHHLGASAEQMVSPSLLPDGARPVAIDTPDYRLRFGEGGWQLDPPNPKLSGDDLGGRAAEWTLAQGLAVERFEGSESERKVSVKLENGALLEFLVLEKDGKTWLVRPDNGLGYQLPADSVLLKRPEPKAAEPAPAEKPAQPKPDA